MKKFSIILYAITAISSTTFAGDKEFIDFAVKQVHDRNFNGCNEALLDIFKDVGGSNIRVLTGINPDLKNQIRVTAVTGSKGDSVYIDALITKANNKCVVTKTVTIIDNGKSCTASLADSKPFEYITETVDYIFAKNPGGVDLLLAQAGNSCVKFYQKTNTYKAN